MKLIKTLAVLCLLMVFGAGVRAQELQISDGTTTKSHVRKLIFSAGSLTFSGSKITVAGGGASGSFSAANGSAAAPSILFTNSTTTGFFRSGADIIGVATAGVERWDFDASGHFKPFANNTYDLGTTALGLRTGYFATSVINPLYTSAAGVAVTLKPAAASGTDTAGGALTESGGASTGTAAGGNIVKTTAFSAATGSSANTLVDREVIVAQGKTLTDNTATSLFEVAMPAGAMVGLVIEATVRCTDATDFQSYTQVIVVSSVNKAGTYTDVVSTSTTATEAKAVSAGTIVNSWTVVDGTNKITVKLTSDTSLTPSGTNGFVVYYRIKNNSQNAVTVL
jgi:hypothetical protein